MPTGEGIIAQIDCGGTVLAGITPKACRDMALQEGDTVYCLAKTQSFEYLADPAPPRIGRMLNFADAAYPGPARRGGIRA